MHFSIGVDAMRTGRLGRVCLLELAASRARAQPAPPRPFCSFSLCFSSLACSLSPCSSSLWPRLHGPRSDRSRSSTAQSSPTSTRGRSRRPSSEASTKSIAAYCPMTTTRSVRRETSSSQTSTPMRESPSLFLADLAVLTLEKLTSLASSWRVPTFLLRPTSAP